MNIKRIMQSALILPILALSNGLEAHVVKNAPKLEMRVNERFRVKGLELHYYVDRKNKGEVGTYEMPDETLIRFVPKPGEKYFNEILPDTGETVIFTDPSKYDHGKIRVLFRDLTDVSAPIVVFDKIKESVERDEESYDGKPVIVSNFKVSKYKREVLSIMAADSLPAIRKYSLQCFKVKDGGEYSLVESLTFWVKFSKPEKVVTPKK